MTAPVPDRVVPIESLFFGDAGPHVVSPAAPPAESPGAPVAAAVRTRPTTPRGSSLQALLASSLAGLTPLDSEPLSKPAFIDDEVVLIETLVYRGRAAIDRALELRRDISVRGGAPSPEEIDELFELLDLAVKD